MRRLQLEFFAALSWTTLASYLLVAEAEVTSLAAMWPAAMWPAATLLAQLLV
jgi:hypothetical protein